MSPYVNIVCASVIALTIAICAALALSRRGAWRVVRANRSVRVQFAGIVGLSVIWVALNDVDVLAPRLTQRAVGDLRGLGVTLMLMLVVWFFVLMALLYQAFRNAQRQ